MRSPGKAAPPRLRLARRLAGRFAHAVVCAPILVYQRLISPALPRRCKYEPTCSRYAVQAISRYGAVRGLVLASWRLLRCNPWSYGGYDPVDAQRVFAQRPAAHACPGAASSVRATPSQRRSRGGSRGRRAPTPAGQS